MAQTARRLGPVLRRLMVTPTFAAGLGVVVAACLAVNMPKGVLHFSSPFWGKQCAPAPCQLPGKNGGKQASARPGVHITERNPSRRGRGPEAPSPASGGPGAAKIQPHRPRGHVRVTYQVASQWDGGFVDQITITGLNARQAKAWTLGIRYPGERIDVIAGVASWQRDGRDTAVARGPSGGDGQDSPAVPPGQRRQAQLQIKVLGQPIAPTGCAFNGRTCSFAPAPVLH